MKKLILLLTLLVGFNNYSQNVVAKSIIPILQASPPSGELGKLYCNANGIWFRFDGTEWVVDSNSSVQLDWEFDTDITATDPTTGLFKFNNATTASITEIYISMRTNGSQSNMTSFFNNLKSGNQIYIAQTNDTSNYFLFTVVSVVDNTHWFTISVSIDTTNANNLPDSTANCGFIFLPVTADLDGYVTIDTPQTILEEKTFDKQIVLNGSQEDVEKYSFIDSELDGVVLPTDGFAVLGMYGDITTDGGTETISIQMEIETKDGFNSLADQTPTPLLRVTTDDVHRVLLSGRPHNDGDGTSQLHSKLQVGFETNLLPDLSDPDMLSVNGTIRSEAIPQEITDVANDKGVTTVEWYKDALGLTFDYDSADLYVDRVLADGGSIDGKAYDYLAWQLANLQGTETIAIFPAGYKAGTLYGIDPRDYSSSVNDFTFTRSTEAYRTNQDGILELMPIDVPRIDYANDVPEILLEPESENLVLWSQDFSNASWIKEDDGVAIAPIITSNYAIAPDGSATADRVVFDLNGGSTIGDRSRIIQSTAITDDLVGSIYIKSRTGSNYNMTLQTSISSITIVVTSQWQRFEINDSNLINNLQLKLTGGGTDDDYTDVLIWNAQLELGTVATSPIKTEGTTVTRGAELCVGAGDITTISSEQGVLMAEMTGIESGIYKQITLSNGSNNNRAEISASSGESIATKYRETGTFVYQNFSVESSLTNIKTALSYKPNEFKTLINGSQNGATDTSGNTVSANTFDRLNLSNPPANSEYYYGRIRQIRHLPNPDVVDLEELTKPSITTTLSRVALKDIDNYFSHSQTFQEDIVLKEQDTPPPYEEGKIWYGNDTFNFYDNIPGTSIQSGKEIVIDVYNGNGATLTNFTVVRVDGTNNGYPSVVRAKADTVDNALSMGICTHDIGVGLVGKVTTQGTAGGDSSMWSVGDFLYLSSTADGELTNVEQPILKPVAFVLVADTEENGGSIYVFQRPILNITAIGQVLSGALETQSISVVPEPLEIYTNTPFELNTTITQTGAEPYTAEMSPESVGGTGYYRVAFNITISSATNTLFYYEIYIDSTPTGVLGIIDLSNNNTDAGSTSFNGITQQVIDNTEDIEIYVYSDSGTPTFICESAVFNIERIGTN